MIKQRLAIYFYLSPMDDVPDLKNYKNNVGSRVDECLKVIRERLDIMAKESQQAVAHMHVEEQTVEVSG